MQLLIAFHKSEIFGSSNLKKLALEESEILVVCPYDFIYYFFSLRNKFLLKPFEFFLKDTANYLKKNISDLKIKVEKPNFFYVVYFFPISLFKTIKNLFKLIKILKGDKSYLYSNNINITGYCLDSLQRFLGKKFNIEKENSFSNIFSAFFYLLFLEIYTNWFIYIFKKKEIKKVIINHEVYAESGLFAEYSQLLHKSKIYLCQKTFRDIVNIVNIRKDIFNYMQNLKSVDKYNSNFFWYTSNSIMQQSNFAKKKIDLNRVLVVMHAFGDANHIHCRPGFEPLFQTFYHWVKKTLEIAKSLENQIFTFRSHPSGIGFYRNDKIIISKLFKNLPKNIKFEDSTLIDDPLHHFKEKIPIMITYKGSINLEMGCSGIKVVALDKRIDDQSAIIPNNLSEYQKILAGNLDSNEFYLKTEETFVHKKIKNNLKNFIHSNPK